MVQSDHEGKIRLRDWLPNFLRDGHRLVTDSRDRANILNKFFSSVFNPASTASPSLSASPSSGVGEKQDSIELTTSEVREVLLSLDPNKECGPDNIPGSLLKNTAAEIALPWSQRFFLFFIVLVGAAREPRSDEHESRSGEKEKPLVTLDLNLTFMQTPGSGCDPRARIG